MSAPSGDVVLQAPTPEATRRIGQALGRSSAPGTLFLLEGDFGAGKTTLVQGMAIGLGSSESVTSPSFVIENQYEGGRLRLYHVDLYRLERLDPAFLDELEEHLFGEGVAAVEWPGLLPDSFRDEATVIHLERLADDVRRVTVRRPTAAQRAELVACLPLTP